MDIAGRYHNGGHWEWSENCIQSAVYPLTGQTLTIRARVRTLSCACLLAVFQGRVCGNTVEWIYGSSDHIANAILSKLGSSAWNWIWSLFVCLRGHKITLEQTKTVASDATINEQARCRRQRLRSWNVFGTYPFRFGWMNEPIEDFNWNECKHDRGEPFNLRSIKVERSNDQMHWIVRGNRTFFSTISLMSNNENYGE